MRQIVYSQRLGGRLTAVAPGVLAATLAGSTEPATVDAQLSFADERSFRLTGEIRLEGEGTPALPLARPRAPRSVGPSPACGTAPPSSRSAAARGASTAPAGGSPRTSSSPMTARSPTTSSASSSSPYDRRRNREPNDTRRGRPGNSGGARSSARPRDGRRRSVRARRPSRRRRARRVAAPARRARSRYTSCTTCSLNGKAVPRSWASVVLATAQPSFSPPTRQSAGTNTSSKNTSLNSASLGDRHERADLDPVGLHVHDEIGDAPVLRQLGVGAREADAPARELRVARPHLLARQHPATLDRHGSRGQAGEIGARAGLAEELAPDLAGVEDRRQPAPLLLVGSVREQRRTGEVDAVPVHRLERTRAARTPC